MERQCEFVVARSFTLIARNFMISFLPIKRLIIATHNKGKWREFADMLAPFIDDVVAAGDLGLPEPDETGLTFLDNALIKARAAAVASQTVALADDSGLCVSALEGQPGVYSARWGGPHKDFNGAMYRVHDELSDNPDRSARFVCSLALAWPNGQYKVFEGEVEGHIVWPPQGTGGHGYDPIFMPNGFSDTFADMNADRKNAISHRGKAVRQLLAFLGAL